MIKQIKQKCLTLRSRTEKPYFSIQNRVLKCNPTDVVIKSVCFSVDPVMKFALAGARTYFRIVQIGDIFNCFGLAKVIQGSQQFQVGTYIFGNIGTCDINIFDELRQVECFPVPTHLVKMYGQKQFLYLINNGLAAYSGYKILSPMPGENVVVSTASGATGLLLCQLLKKKGIKVIGLTSNHKMNVVSKYVEQAIDYKESQKLEKVLEQIKFKYYFDNVGQNLLDLILKHIAIDGRIALCGAIANYENYSNRGIKNTMMIISKRLTLTGLTFMAMLPNIDEAFKEFKDIQLRILIIKMQDFQYYFTQILKSGNDLIGKIIVEL